MSLLPVDEALTRILKSAEPRGKQQVALAEAGGRIVASPVLAHYMQPLSTDPPWTVMHSSLRTA